jgi:hypothetical protein
VINSSDKRISIFNKNKTIIIIIKISEESMSTSQEKKPKPAQRLFKFDEDNRLKALQKLHPKSKPEEVAQTM